MITITITPEDRDALVEQIARVIAYGDDCERRGDEAPAKIVAKLVNERVREIVSHEAVETLDAEVRKVAAAQVEQLLSEGVKRYDDYGRVKETKSLADLVKSRLFGDGNYNKGLVEESLKAAIDRAFGQHGELGLIIADGKAKLRAAFDQQVTARFTAAIREAVGLK